MPRVSKPKESDADATGTETPAPAATPGPQNALEQAAKKNKTALMETAMSQAVELESLKAELAKRNAKRTKSALADDQSSAASSGSDTEDDVVPQKKKKKEKNAAKEKSEMSKLSHRVGKVKGRVVIEDSESDDEDMKKKFKKWLKDQDAGKGKGAPAAEQKEMSSKALAQ